MRNPSSQLHKSPLRYALPCALLLCAVFLWRVAANGAQLAQSHQGLQTYACPIRTAADYDAMRRIEESSISPRAFALWAQTDGQFALDPISQNKASVSLLHVKGDARLVLPLCGALDEDDLHGCLIDRATALALFKTVLAEGNTLQIGDRSYTVRGVFEGPKGSIVLRPGPDETLSLVSVHDASMDESFSQRQGLLQQQPQPYAQIASVLCSLPPLAALYLCAAALLRALKRHRAYPLRHALLCAAFFAALTLFALHLLRMLPPAFTPSRWSDLSYYGSALTRFTDGAVALFATRKTQSDLYLAALCAPSFLALLSTVALLFAHARLRLLLAQSNRPAL